MPILEGFKVLYKYEKIQFKIPCSSEDIDTIFGSPQYSLGEPTKPLVLIGLKARLVTQGMFLPILKQQLKVSRLRLYNSYVYTECISSQSHSKSRLYESRSYTGISHTGIFCQNYFSLLNLRKIFSLVI